MCTVVMIAAGVDSSGRASGMSHITVVDVVEDEAVVVEAEGLVGMTGKIAETSVIAIVHMRMNSVGRSGQTTSKVIMAKVDSMAPIALVLDTVLLPPDILVLQQRRLQL